MQAREQKTDKRARILEAAINVFASRGFFSATVAEIARAAGVADGTIYLYFKSKDDLLLSLFDEKMGELYASAQEALRSAVGAADEVRAFILHHLQAVERYPELATVLIVELRQSAQAKAAGSREALQNYLNLVADAVRRGQDAGELDPQISPSTVKRAVFGALDELALAWLRSGKRSALKKTAAEVAEWLVRGLRAPQDSGGGRT